MFYICHCRGAFRFLIALSFVCSAMVLPAHTVGQTPTSSDGKPSATVADKAAADKKILADKKAAQKKQALAAKKAADAARAAGVAKTAADKVAAESNAGNSKPALAPQDALNATFTTQDVRGDYVPCKFSLTQLRGLILPDVAPTLSAADGERLKQRIIASAVAANTSPLGPESPLTQFVDEISKASFTGRTPGEALNLVIQELSKHVVGGMQTDQQKLKGYVDSMGTKFSDMLSKLSLSASPTPAQDAYKKILSEDGGKVDDNSKAFVAAAKQKATSEKEDQAALAASGTILSAARKSVAFAERPEDVGCAMSILDWKETSQAFGHVIANEYIAVQVVVRNLNRDQQFVLHDVEFEVNADPTGRLGRFFSGRDKVIVRALSSSQSVGDPRNITIHSAQGIGHILSAVAPYTLPGQAVTFAAGAMNTALVADLDRYWKDLTVEQGNLLNDVGFSSTSNSQSVVPKDGTTMFVTFIPARPFEEGWWTQPCVEVQYLGSTDDDGHVFNLSRQNADGVMEGGTTASAFPGSPTGVDVARALETCMRPQLPSRDNRKWWTLGIYKSGDGGLTQQPSGLLDSTVELPLCSATQNPEVPDSVTGVKPVCSLVKPSIDLFRNAYRKPYHHWSPNAQSIFREISNTVVSGMHIVEDQQLTASVTDVKCPKDTSGNLKFPDTGSDLTCPVTGKNLDKVARLRLRNSKVATDTVTADGPLQVVGDNTTGTLTLKISELRTLTAQDYDLFAVTLNGVETKTAAVIHFDLTPAILTFDPALDFSDSKASIAFTLTGVHLASVKALTLSAGGKTLKAASLNVTDTAIDGQSCSQMQAHPHSLPVQ
jgi:hypothetical protein